MGKRANKLHIGKSPDTIQRQVSKEFYQTKEWKQLRERLRKKRRKQHEQIVMKVYKENPENKPEDLKAFVESNMPLCEHNLKKGIIKVASVLDHKVRVRKGGAKLSPSNLQWVTEEYHNRKSAQEAHE